MRQRSPCVCAVRECVALLLPGTAMQAKQRLSSHFTLPFSHPALQKPHFISSKLHFRNFFHTANFYTEKLLHREAFTHRRFDTEGLLNAPCASQTCACVALLPSTNMTCVRPPCRARPREDFLRSSAQLSSSYLISFLFISLRVIP